jgi:hypothetical protein
MASPIDLPPITVTPGGTAVAARPLACRLALAHLIAARGGQTIATSYAMIVVLAGALALIAKHEY